MQTCKPRSRVWKMETRLQEFDWLASLKWRCCKWSTWLPEWDECSWGQQEEGVRSNARGIRWCHCRCRRWSSVHGKCTFCNELKTLSSLCIHRHFPPAAEFTPPHSTQLHSLIHSFIHSLICCNIVAKQPTMMSSNECGNRFDSNRNSKWLLSLLRDLRPKKKSKHSLDSRPSKP